MNIESLRLAGIAFLSINAEKISGLDVNHANISTNTSFVKNESHLGIKVEYILKLNNGSEEKNEECAQFELAIGVDFIRTNPEEELSETEIQEFAHFALIAAHPYARQEISKLAQSLSLPSVTLGILRIGEANPETITIGNQILSFAPTL